eukprot:TRINITY_DN5009_c0_g1_i1.p1 TRINITY_DN5009_c0_g1~~TRINITY_DN5009_c0_g1_i1.p1  ORF type:complete len:560 (+),score=65.46 TRINITY_DN5009_c0_g1_i1:98-1777(+)
MDRRGSRLVRARSCSRSQRHSATSALEGRRRKRGSRGTDKQADYTDCEDDRRSEQSASEKNTLFIGQLSFTAGENDIEDALRQCGEIVSVRIIKDDRTGNSKGFGFITFKRWTDAEECRSTMDGVDIAGRRCKLQFVDGKKMLRNLPRSGKKDSSREDRAERRLRANDAYPCVDACGASPDGEQSNCGPPRHSVDSKLLIGGLAPHATEDDIIDVFSHFGDLQVQIIKDRKTQRSRGFGFIEFEDEYHSEEALESMQSADVAGVPCRLERAGQKISNSGGAGMDRRGSRHVRTRSRSRSQRRSATSALGGRRHERGSGSTDKQADYIGCEDDRRSEQSASEKNTLFIGQLSFTAGENDIEDALRQCGEIVSVRIIKDDRTGNSKGFGFITFKKWGDAVKCQSKMDGVDIAGRRCKLQFTRGQIKHSAANKLLIGSLAPHATEDDIIDVFSHFGDLQVQIIKDRKKKCSRGFGFIEFEDEYHSEEALESMQGAEVAGVPCRLERAGQKESNSGGEGKDRSAQKCSQSQRPRPSAAPSAQSVYEQQEDNWACFHSDDESGH